MFRATRVSDNIYNITNGNRLPFVGFVIGPIEIIIGLAQTILNGLAMLFSREKKGEKYETFKVDAKHGLEILGNGLFDCFPGTWMVSSTLHMMRVEERLETLRRNLTTIPNLSRDWGATKL